MLKTYIYDWGGGNVALFHWINDWRGDFLDRFMWLGTVISDHRNFPYYAAAAAVAAFATAARDARAQMPSGQDSAYRCLTALGLFCVAYLVDGLFLTLAKSWFDFPRPVLALGRGAVHVVGKTELHEGFPSGHASFAVTVVASFWPVLDRPLRGLGVFFVLWVGISRVNVGAHFPADVVAGMVSAFVIVIGVRAALAVLARPMTRS